MVLRAVDASCVVDGGALPLSRIGALSPRHLRFLRERVLRHVARIGGEKTLPRKVYLLRGNRSRVVRAEPRIRDALLAEGFTAVDPAQLEFEDQVRLFRDAETIVAAQRRRANQSSILRQLSGRACATRFAPGRIHSLPQSASDRRGRSLLRSAGASAARCARAVNEEQYMHADYEVSPEDVVEALWRLRSETWPAKTVNLETMN